LSYFNILTDFTKSPNCNVNVKKLNFNELNKYSLNEKISSQFNSPIRGGRCAVCNGPTLWEKGKVKCEGCAICSCTPPKKDPPPKKGEEEKKYCPGSSHCGCDLPKKNPLKKGKEGEKPKAESS